ncbi:rRNA maturation RNase YbeY [Nonlabens xiamenensis]|uniref:rRNA maturation RNase YbeY n=1 Tax=Nonlabens xiamenensis TaxID=2341043 RepID=UPI0029390A1F|nr:rRNA maturation RNase YbeY [Nonlabens xiamenensis]
MTYARWLNVVASSEAKTIGELSYVFCDDEYLLRINQDHLEHDTYTDIITFDYTDDALIKGEVYISTDRVAENAVLFSVDTLAELHRVIVHGLLHLCGYTDASPQEKQLMRMKEDEKMKLFHVKH